MERNQFDVCFDFEQDYISGEKRIIFSFSFSYNEKDIEHVYNSLNEKRKEIQVRVGGPNKIKFKIKNKNIYMDILEEGRYKKYDDVLFKEILIENN